MMRDDLLALGQGSGQTPAQVPVQHNPEPPSVAAPRAVGSPRADRLRGEPVPGGSWPGSKQAR